MDESKKETKVCKYCQSEIPKKAKICPNCRKKQKKATGCLTTILIVFVILVLFIFIFGSGNNGVDKETIQTAKDIPVDTFKSQCQTISYSDLMRTPDNFKGNYIKLEVQVSQVLGDTNYVVYTKGKDDSKEYGYYGDQYSIYDNREDKSTKLIEDDFVTMYGIYGGTENITTITGESKDIPLMNLLYIELNN